MCGYITELKIENERVDEETANLYRDLGLCAVRKGSSLVLHSTDVTRIRSFETGLKLAISRRKYNSLMNKKVITRTEDGRCLLQDNVGTPIAVEPVEAKRKIRMAVLTSGGDSPGMNSAVKSIVRYSLKNRIEVFGVYRGFEGLIAGDMRRLDWDCETHSSGQSGTYLMSARSARFKTREGRKEAAFNLIIRNIDALVVIGGDGSMAGALALKEEFEELYRELISEGRLNNGNIDQKRKEEQEMRNEHCIICKTATAPLNTLDDSGQEPGSAQGRCSESDESSEFVFDIETPRGIHVMGLPGTIDNDILGTDATIGCDTALMRVSEVVETLISTMRSHRRVFVLECMGRMCGWITLMAGFAVDAEYIFIPEAPNTRWRGEMVESVRTAYYNNKQNIFVFMSEGAIDGDGNVIGVKDVEREIEQAGIEVRSLVLGHLQRGGVTSARDRFLGTVLGMKAVEHVMNGVYNKVGSSAVMIVYVDDEAKPIDLQVVVEASKRMKACYEQRLYDEVMNSRCRQFQEVYRVYEHQRKGLNEAFRKETPDRRYMIEHQRIHREKKLSSAVPSDTKRLLLGKSRRRVGVLAMGDVAGGMNAVLSSLVQFGLCSEIDMVYFLNGHNGILDTRVRSAEPFEFSIVQGQGGIEIGSSNPPADWDAVLRKLDEYKLDNLIAIGGTPCLNLAMRSDKVLVIPCAASNNFPGVSMCIGSETALNAIITCAESTQTSSTSVGKKVHLMEVGGGNCGYLSVVGAMCSSAFEAIYPESSRLEDILEINRRIRAKCECGTLVIVRSVEAFDRIPGDALCKLLCSGSDVEYQCTVVSGMQGGLMIPSMLDRVYAKMLAYRAIDLCRERGEGGIVGICKGQVKLVSVSKALEKYDWANDTVRDPEWLRYSNVVPTLE